MSLTLPANYESASKSGNFKENWVAQLFNTDSYLSFDGTDDVVSCGATTATSPISITSTTVAGGTGLTICGWVNFPVVGSDNQFIFVNNTQHANWSGISIFKGTDNLLKILYGDGSEADANDYKTIKTKTATISLDTWTFFAIVTDFADDLTGSTIYLGSGTTLTAYTGTGGLAAGGSGSNTAPVYGTGIANIGNEIVAADSYAQFKIKNLALYAAQLDSNNITALFNTGNYKSFLYDFGNYDNSSTLKAYWELNNGEPTIQDLSGNGANGTITGATYEGFLPLSLSDTTIDSIFYHGCVTRVGSVRDSIDLAKSQAKTSNISLNLANFKYKGDSLSAELFLGSRDYYNYNVRIYSQLNGSTALSDCLQVYQGRLINIAHDQSNITMQLTEQRPWDFIEIPSEKVTTSRTYIPVVYGGFTENDSEASIANANFSESRALFPAPVENTSGKITALVPRKYDGTTDEDGRLHHYEKEADRFVPIHDTTFTDVAEDYENAYSMSCTLTLPRGFKTKPLRSISSDFTNPDNAIDKREDDSSSQTYATNTITTDAPSSGVTTTTSKYLKLSPPNVVGLLSALSIQLRYVFTFTTHNDSSNTALTIDSPYSKTISISSSASQGNPTFASLISMYTSNNNQIPEISIKQHHSVEEDGSATDDTCTATIYDVKLFIVAALDQANDKEGTKQYLDGLNYMYVGANGLTETYSGSGGEIEHGHEALRDMLVRFTGFDTADPDGWSALHTDRHISTWAIRWWALEPTALKPVLERLMFEFGFIFKFRADGSGRVIHILQTSEMQTIADSGSPYPVLKSSDIANISVSTSSFDDMITKMVINYEKHPANNKYLSEVTSTNDASRTKYKIKIKENIKEEKLQMNVGTPNTTGQTDPNTDFYSYYNNIFGDIKKIIRCDVVNPAKGYAMETGDIIQFSSTAGDMPVDPFGHGWDQNGYDFFMITKLVRNIGSVKIECREVG